MKLETTITTISIFERLHTNLDVQKSTEIAIHTVSCPCNKQRHATIPSGYSWHFGTKC